MEKRGLSQETLKIIACVTMLIDHIGATVIPWFPLRMIGRLSFPIFCFLLAEGVNHTRNPRRYGLRLLIGAFLSEIPFDLLFYGRLTMAHQSVMVTLLLGFMMVMWAKKMGNILLPFAVSFFAAELLNTDYGGYGVAVIALFAVSYDKPKKWLIELIGMTVIMLLMRGRGVTFGAVRIPIQLFALFALIPIFMYSGQKRTDHIWIQRGFYLFYPVHLAVLCLICGRI